MATAKTTVERFKAEKTKSRVDLKEARAAIAQHEKDANQREAELESLRDDLRRAQRSQSRSRSPPSGSPLGEGAVSKQEHQRALRDFQAENARALSTAQAAMAQHETAIAQHEKDSKQREAKLEALRGEHQQALRQTTDRYEAELSRVLNLLAEAAWAPPPRIEDSLDLKSEAERARREAGEKEAEKREREVLALREQLRLAVAERDEVKHARKAEQEQAGKSPSHQHGNKNEELFGDRVEEEEEEEDLTPIQQVLPDFQELVP
jgi:hypothetical protein